MGYEPLINGKCYHIYNRGNMGCDLFTDAECYEHFLYLYEIYIHPVAETYAWVLMPNHFHLLVGIRENRVYRYEMTELELQKGDARMNKWETVDLACCENGEKRKRPVAYRHFAHLCNAYSRYDQARNGRRGNLFERPFKRIKVDTEDYFKRAVVYIHQNPVHHGFCSHPLEYPWSGYPAFTGRPREGRSPDMNCEAVTKLFGTPQDFEKWHREKVNREEIESLLQISEPDYYTAAGEKMENMKKDE